MLATSTLEIRQKVLGVLANAAAQEDLLDFIVNSGVFRICKGIPGKGWFVEHFALMIELTRMLANLPGLLAFSLSLGLKSLREHESGRGSSSSI